MNNCRAAPFRKCSHEFRDLDDGFISSPQRMKRCVESAISVWRQATPHNHSEDKLRNGAIFRCLPAKCSSHSHNCICIFVYQRSKQMERKLSFLFIILPRINTVLDYCLLPLNIKYSGTLQHPPPHSAFISSI